MAIAFPLGKTLDTFDRAALGGNWTNNPWGWGSGSWTITSNQMTNATGPPAEPWAAWNLATYGPDCEVWATLVAKPSTAGDYFTMLMGMGPLGAIADQDGYNLTLVVEAGTDTVQIERQDSGVGTALVTWSQEVSAGNKLGFQRIGSTLYGYIDTGSGWTLLGSTTDSTYTGAGYLALGAGSSSTVTVANFGGGNSYPPPLVLPRPLTRRNTQRQQVTTPDFYDFPKPRP